MFGLEDDILFEAEDARPGLYAVVYIIPADPVAGGQFGIFLGPMSGERAWVLTDRPVEVPRTSLRVLKKTALREIAQAVQRAVD